MGRYDCAFSYYRGEAKTAEVTISNGVVTTTPFTESKELLPFGFVADRNVSRKVIDAFYERHCVPRHRANIRDFLDSYGLETYDAFKICRVTGGVMADNDARIEWTG